jgi:NAD(P)-dependent dehydrogenase (short-subunit alcohol dehydrogenase family)
MQRTLGGAADGLGWRAIVADRTQSALITGGTGGLGAAVVDAFLAAGRRVVVPWIYESELERLPEREGLELVRADLFEPDEVSRAVRTATAEPAAPLRAVVNLVGGFDAPGNVVDVPLERFERQFTLNLRPTYLVCQAAIPPLIEVGGGAIVCVSSRAGVHPFPGAAGYCASKAAVLAFAKALDAEYAAAGVRTNAILPSQIDTPANREAMPPEEHSKLVPPQQIASVILYLCSDESAATSGAAVPVYGRA